MSWTSWLVWGFFATAVLTTLMAGSEGFGLTRMNIPHMLGTMFTANRDRAKVYGAVVHFMNGWAFSIVYVAGYGLTSDRVPSIYRRAIICLCTYWYNNRDALACEDAGGVIGRLESILAIEGRTVEYA